MAAPKLLCLPLLSLLVLLLAYWFRHVEKDNLQDRLDTVLSSLLRAEQKVGLDVERPPRIAIGEYNMCIYWFITVLYAQSYIHILCTYIDGDLDDSSTMDRAHGGDFLISYAAR